MTTQPNVTCIILNWNGWRDTLECLGALEKCAYPHMDILIVDNASTNDSVARIRAAYPHIRIFESEKNLGFAGGNNIAIRHALAQSTDYIWLLNNDTEPAPDALSTLVAKAQTDQRIGAVASICYYTQQPDVVQIWAGGRVNLWIGHAPYSTEPRNDNWFHWLNGTSLLITKEALNSVGLLDEGYFLYWEDNEFCLRLRKNGWRIAAAPSSRVLHKVSTSTGRNELLLDRYSTTSALRTLRLYSVAPYLAMLLFLIMRFSRRLARLQFSRCKSVWEGVRDYRRSLPVAPKIR